LASAAAASALLGWFCLHFNAGANQPLVDSLWLLAIALWTVTVCGRMSPGPMCPRLPAGSLWPILTILLLFATAWLPFFGNWRWAYTGDSIAWFGPAYDAATRGLTQNILSLHGPDNNFTYLHSLAFNLPMFLLEPTLFWHRVGKLIVSCLSLAAIYTFFAVHLGRWWAAALVICVATNYVFLWFSYVSYPHVDSFILAYLTLTTATFLWRDKDRLTPWLACGFLAGFSLFFTQTAWAAVSAVGVVLGVHALATMRYRQLGIYAASFLIVSVPVFLQWPALMDMTTRQTASVYQPDYLWRIFTAILKQPYESGIFGLGVNGAFLRWPLGPMYLLGCTLGLVSLVGPLRRKLRIPSVTPVLILLLLWESVLMTLTNNAYGDPSTKRTYHLIPLQVFLALVPASVLMAWVRRWPVARAMAAAAVCAVIALYGAANMRMIIDPAPAMYGSNEFDGLIELRQRHPDRRVVFFTSRPQMPEWVLSPTGFYAMAYHLPDTIAVELEFSPHALRAACDANAVICHAPYTDAQRFEKMAAEARVPLTRLPLLNSRVLACAECEDSRPRGSEPAQATQ